MPNSTKEPKLRNEPPLLIEWERNGTWYGHTGDKYVGPFRRRAYKDLGLTPEKYVYINKRIRISYYDPC